MAFDKSKDTNPTVAFFNIVAIDEAGNKYPGRIKGIPIKGNSAFEKAMITNAKANPDMMFMAEVRVHVLDDTAKSEFVFAGAVPVAAAPVVTETPAVEAVIPAPVAEAEQDSIPF